MFIKLDEVLGPAPIFHAFGWLAAAAVASVRSKKSGTNRSEKPARNDQTISFARLSLIHLPALRSPVMSGNSLPPISPSYA